LALTTTGTLLFAALYLFHPRTVERVQTVTQMITNGLVQWMTNTVVKEVEIPKIVEKVVEKTVEVPAAIPKEYQDALSLSRKIGLAKLAEKNSDFLAKGEPLHIDYVIGDEIKGLITTDEVKAKFELVLRRNNVPVTSKVSINQINISIAGINNHDLSYIIYSTSFSLKSGGYAFLDERAVFVVGTVWDFAGSYGTQLRSDFKSKMLQNVESAAEIIANAWLEANSTTGK
jgi:hypothetical protein